VITQSETLSNLYRIDIGVPARLKTILNGLKGTYCCLRPGAGCAARRGRRYCKYITAGTATAISGDIPFIRQPVKAATGDRAAERGHRWTKTSNKTFRGQLALDDMLGGQLADFIAFDVIWLRKCMPKLMTLKRSEERVEIFKTAYKEVRQTRSHR
jgi:hypothetical protein